MGNNLHIAVVERKRFLDEYLRLRADHGDRIAEALLERGEWFVYEGRPDDIELGEAKNCYGNAGGLALVQWGVDTAAEAFAYYEGYVVTPEGFPIEHAWCVRDGELIEPTLRSKDDTECAFCLGNGWRQQCEGVGQHSPYGWLGEVDVDCEDCGGCGCEEVECVACGGSGEADRVRDLAGAVYVGVPIASDALRKFVLSSGVWGAHLWRTFEDEEVAA